MSMFPILMYHRIEDADYMHKAGLFLSGIETRKERLREHLSVLHEHYTVLPLEEIIARRKNNKPLPENVTCLTFDDGTRDHLEVLLPILEEFSTPATYFVMTGPLEGILAPTFMLQVLTGDTALAEQLYHEHLPKILKENNSGWYEPFLNKDPDVIPPKEFYISEKTQAIKDIKYLLNFKMTAEEKKQVSLALIEAVMPGISEADIAKKMFLTGEDISTVASSRLITIGSHLITHNKLSTLPEEAAIYELEHSKKTLEQYTNKPVTIVGYTASGIEGISEKVMDAIRTNYEGGCTLLSRRDEFVEPHHIIHALPRIDEKYFERVMQR